MPSYDEILEAREAEAVQKAATGPSPQRVESLLRESARGAAVLTDLLDSPAWNIFRSVLGADLQVYEAERNIMREQIEAGTLVGDDRERADRRLQYLRGAIEKLTRAMELPKELIARHATLETAMGGSRRDEANGSVGGPEAAGEADGTRYPAPPPVVRSAAGGGRPDLHRKRKKS